MKLYLCIHFVQLISPLDRQFALCKRPSSTKEYEIEIHTETQQSLHLFFSASYICTDPLHLHINNSSDKDKMFSSKPREYPNPILEQNKKD